MVNHLLQTVPPVAVYLVVGLAIGIESIGVYLPGQTVLISAVLLVALHQLPASALWIGVAAAIGAIVGDSIGYSIGRRWGRPLFAWLGRKRPRLFGPARMAYVERFFDRWGVLAVFFGRFILPLRTFAGPLAGVVKMPYRRFLVANVVGGIFWAGGLTVAAYYFGAAAEKWFNQFSYIALIVAVLGHSLVGLIVQRWVRRRRRRHQQKQSQAQQLAQEPERSDAR